MNRLNRSAALTFTVMLCAGCVPKATPTVEYFRAHQDERVAQLHRCSNEAARSQGDPACVNAREAERIESVGSLRDLPPVGLTPVQPAPHAEEQSNQEQN